MNCFLHTTAPWRLAARQTCLAVLAFIVGSFGAIPLAAQDVTELEEQTIRAAVQHVAPSVVRIDTVGGLEQVGEVLLGEGPTTGLIVSADGYIISSAFNFLRQPSSILVTLPGGSRVPAEIVARDQSRKLVLLKVTAKDPLPVPEPVPSDEIIVGQRAIAVGRTLAQDKPNMSVGIVSARHRIWGKAVQTDAKISPSNYGGPLIDLRGRVFGVLVPLSPNSQHELAGAEWYDGGIGFAVPLADINPRLDRMKKGEDLHPGMLGVTLKSGDIYSLSAEIAACHPKSPAYKAGLRKGDVIVDINGSSIERQAQLRHVLGPLYAGEKVKIVANRGSEKLNAELELVKEIDPYEHPFLGILPVRVEEADKAGVEVRYVYPESGAATAGIQVKDRIVKLAGQDVKSAQAFREAVAAFEPGNEVEIAVMREGAEQKLKVKLGKLPTGIPDQKAVQSSESDEPTPDAKPAETTSVKIPEEPNQCIAYVPSSYRQETPAGLLVILPRPGDFQAEELTRDWAALAERYGLIVAAPQSQLDRMWLPTESAFIRKVIDHFTGKYNIDRNRIVLYGSQASGAMAYLTAFRLRDVVRGLVAVEATVPRILSRPPDNDPIERLAVLSIVFASSPGKSQVEKNAEELREMKYPVVVRELSGSSRPLENTDRDEIVRWLETLDRI